MPPPPKRIALLLAFPAFAATLLAGTVCALLFAVLDYWDNRTRMEEEITRLMTNRRVACSDALLRTDRRMAANIIDSFMVIEPVFSASLVDKIGLPLASVRRHPTTSDAGWFFRTFAEGSRSFMLPVFAEAGVEPLGSINIQVDTHQIYGAVIRRATRLLAGALALSLLAGAVVRRSAGRRVSANLDHLHAYLRAATLGETGPEALQLPRPGAGREAEALADAINDFTLAHRQRLAEEEWKTRKARGEAPAPAPAAPPPPAGTDRPDAPPDAGLRGDAATRILLGGDAPPPEAAALLALLARPGLDPPGRCDAVEALAAVRPLLQGLSGAAIRFLPDLPPQPLFVHLPREALMRWAVRCAALARDDMPQGGELRLRATREDNPNPGRRGPLAHISLADTGGGDHDLRVLRERISAPLAAASGGWMELQSAPDLGSRLHLYLPLRPSAPPAALPRRARVLLVHRDAPLRRTLLPLLRNLGLEAVEAPSATDAVATLMDSPAPVDLVLLEGRLPEADCDEVLARLRETQPGLRALVIRDHPAEGPGLVRPFGPDALRDALRQAFNAPAGVDPTDSRGTSPG